MLFGRLYSYRDIPTGPKGWTSLLDDDHLGFEFTFRLQLFFFSPPHMLGLRGMRSYSCHVKMSYFNHFFMTLNSNSFVDKFDSVQNTI